LASATASCGLRPSRQAAKLVCLARSKRAGSPIISETAIHASYLPWLARVDALCLSSSSRPPFAPAQNTNADSTSLFEAEQRNPDGTIVYGTPWTTSPASGRPRLKVREPFLLECRCGAPRLTEFLWGIPDAHVLLFLTSLTAEELIRSGGYRKIRQLQAGLGGPLVRLGGRQWFATHSLPTAFCGVARRSGVLDVSQHGSEFSSPL
jgi:hypothetical protein